MKYIEQRAHMNKKQFSTANELEATTVNDGDNVRYAKNVKKNANTINNLFLY